jgi:predicted nucleic acid-binding protein
MNVVSNAGPLINLAKLGVLRVLPQINTTVVVPPAVYDEVVIRGKEQHHPDAYVVELAIARNELTRWPVPIEELSEAIRELPIDRGEKQAIHLALHLGNDTVLLDDLLAREAAQRLGLPVKGTLGVLPLHIVKSISRVLNLILYLKHYLLAKIFGLAIRLPTTCGANLCALRQNLLILFLICSAVHCTVPATTNASIPSRKGFERRIACKSKHFVTLIGTANGRWCVSILTCRLTNTSRLRTTPVFALRCPRSNT